MIWESEDRFRLITRVEPIVSFTNLGMKNGIRNQTTNKTVSYLTSDLVSDKASVI